MDETATGSGGLRRQWWVGDWLDAPALATLRELNAQAVELACEAAAVAAGGPGGLPPWLAVELAALGPPARRQLARCPYLLVDAGFADEQRWLAPGRPAVRDLRRQALATASVAGAPFSGPGGREFRRCVLTFAWYLARSHRPLARLVLGATPASAARLAALALRDLDTVVEQQPGWVRLRWEQQPTVWRQLLGAARGADEAALQRASLRGLQLLAARVCWDDQRQA